MLRENKMPDDLKFVTIAESALRTMPVLKRGKRGLAVIGRNGHEISSESR